MTAMLIVKAVELLESNHFVCFAYHCCSFLLEFTCAMSVVLRTT
jgi:hypothetical protein